MASQPGHPEVRWVADMPAPSWDKALAALGGHPLQSALWGDARRQVDGIKDCRWAAVLDGETVLMARVEIRTVAKIGRVAWIPRGPVAACKQAAAPAFESLLQRLRKLRFLMCVDNPSCADAHIPAPRIPLSPAARTVWIDLGAGRDKRWASLDSQWRYGVRRAGREGVVVEQSRDPGEVRDFWALCRQLSRQKGFKLPGSEALAQTIVAAPAAESVEARLFLAKCEGRIGAGALVLRSGGWLHYFWGAVDRAHARLRCGEAVQWGVIEWALGHGLATYDLEGVDPAGNADTHQFKMKMGGELVELPVRHAYPLNTVGRIALAAAKALGKL